MQLPPLVVWNDLIHNVPLHKVELPQLRAFLVGTQEAAALQLYQLLLKLIPGREDVRQ